MDFQLGVASSQNWLDCVITNFDQFLPDHASCEKKASGMAMSIISHYPDKPLLLKAMLSLAIEELAHFRDVMEIMMQKGLQATPDRRDEYVNQFQQAMSRGKEAYLMDRLLIASIIEARGAERFGLIAEALPEGELKQFYTHITESESRHYVLFLDLARQLCPPERIPDRLQELLTIEADIITRLPVRAALH